MYATWKVLKLFLVLFRGAMDLHDYQSLLWEMEYTENGFIKNISKAIEAIILYLQALRS